MKSKLTVLIVLAFTAFIAINGCKPKQQVAAQVYDYEASVISTGSMGAEGTTLIQVSGKAKNIDLAVNQAKKNAVHALIFRGIPGSNMSKPIVTEPNAETKNVDYFNKFFADGGKFLQFITVGGDGVKERVKIPDGYKAVINVSVNHKSLRKQLEDDGIARKLNEGF